jgi:hypothetical protein
VTDQTPSPQPEPQPSAQPRATPQPAAQHPADAAAPAAQQHGPAYQLSAPIPPPPPRGVLPWAIGFLSWIPIPIVGAVVGAIVMAAVAPGQRRKGGLAAANANAAANWALTFILGTVLLIGTAIAIPAIATGGRGGRVAPELGAASLTALAVWFALAAAHGVIVIVGTVRATRGSTTRPWAIPFLRG